MQPCSRHHDITPVHQCRITENQAIRALALRIAFNAVACLRTQRFPRKPAAQTEASHCLLGHGEFGRATRKERMISTCKLRVGQRIAQGTTLPRDNEIRTHSNTLNNGDRDSVAHPLFADTKPHNMKTSLSCDIKPASFRNARSERSEDVPNVVACPNHVKTRSAWGTQTEEALCAETSCRIRKETKMVLKGGNALDRTQRASARQARIPSSNE